MQTDEKTHRPPFTNRLYFAIIAKKLERHSGDAYPNRLRSLVISKAFSPKSGTVPLSYQASYFEVYPICTVEEVYEAIFLRLLTVLICMPPTYSAQDHKTMFQRKMKVPHDEEFHGLGMSNIHLAQRKVEYNYSDDMGLRILKSRNWFHQKALPLKL